LQTYLASCNIAGRAGDPKVISPTLSLSRVKFEALYRAHYDCVWRTLRRLGVSERDTSDLTQDVFLTASRRYQDFEGRSSERTWLIGIAFRLASNYRRKASGRHEVLDQTPIDQASSGLELTRQLEHREDIALLETVLQRLPLEQRAVFTMFEMEGLTGEEIAEALEVPLGTVRSRLRLARDAFAGAVASLRGSEQAVLQGGAG
jgi:RNA polymerase sigma-70 factor, ECF subfamily